MNALQPKLARVALGLSLKETSTLLGVSRDTINRFEGGASVKPKTVEAMRARYESAGVIFVDEKGEGPGVRLKKARAE